MSETKKPRVMTPRGFLHKASGKVSAIAFLAQHKAWLETGELACKTTPILVKLEEHKAILLEAKQDTEEEAGKARDEIRGVVLNHMLAKEANKAEEKILNPPEPTRSKPWLA